MDPRDLPDRVTGDPRAAPVPVTTSRTAVLVAARDETLRDRYAAVLEQTGWEVAWTLNAVDASEQLVRRPFDILLCDSAARGVSGAPLWQESRTRYPDLAPVLISLHGADALPRDTPGAGASEVVSAQCSQSELTVALQRCLTLQSLQSRHAQRYSWAQETSSESILDALLSALSTRNIEMEGHTERVTAYTMEMADQMGLSLEDRYHIERGALLHDIGKIGIPDHILHKATILTEGEWAEMRGHPVMGYRMCVKVEMLRTASQVVLRHHEKWDGSGYPNGLMGDAIPLGARIFAVADALDAITSDQPFRAARPFAAARAEIVRGSGTHFDPATVAVFLSITEARWAFLRANAAR